MKRMWGVAGAIMAVAFCLVMLPGRAFANDVSYISDPAYAPGSGIFIEKIDASNATATLLKTTECTWTWGSFRSEVFPDGMQLRIKDNYIGKTISGDVLRIKAVNCGYTWDNRRVDMEVTISDIWTKRKHANFDNICFTWYSAAGGWNGKWFSLRSAGINDRGSVGTTMNVRYKITYTGTNTVVPDAYAFYIDDLDTPQEGVNLHGNLYNRMYLHSNTVCKVSASTGEVSGKDDADLNGDDDDSFKSGVITLSNSGDVQFKWFARGASTHLGPTYTAYPRQYVSASKAADGILHFEGERASYTVSATFPYCSAALRPSYIRIVDDIDEALDRTQAQVKITKGGMDVTNQFTIDWNGARLRVTANNSAICEGTYQMTVSAPIKKGLNFAGYSREIFKGESAYAIPNKAEVRIEGSWEDRLTVTTNTVKDYVTWGFLDVNVGSANNSVSQLGQNSCYSLAGTVSGIYTNSGCTTKYGQVTADNAGHAVTGRIPVGTYYVKEISAGPGFALNTEASGGIKVPGLGTGYASRNDVPQSEDLDGSIMSKRDGELENVRLRENPVVTVIADAVTEMLDGMK